MAPDKKTPRAAALIWRSSMKATSSSSPTSARPGRPSGRLRVFDIVIGMTGSPSSRRSPWRRGAIVSACTSISVCATSRALRSSRFCASCSVIFAARSSCCGTAGKFIGVATSRLFSAAIPGCKRTAFRATRRSSIPMSSSGRRPNASCRTLITTNSSRSRCTWCDPFNGSAGLRPCFARAFTRPISGGPNARQGKYWSEATRPISPRAREAVIRCGVSLHSRVGAPDPAR